MLLCRIISSASPKGFAFESIRGFVDGLYTGKDFPLTLY